MNQTLGDYQILRELASGALGALYIGEHRFLKRPFLLKVLPADLSADRGFLQKFEEVMGSLAAVDHPHLAKVHNVSFSEGKYFLVSDFIGDPLQEPFNLFRYLASNPARLSEQNLLVIVEQVASALGHLHEKGLAHGSLKLNNVLVSRDKENLVISLTDAGMTRILRTDTLLQRAYQALLDGMRENSTDSLAFLQHLAFLPPEQKVSSIVDAKKGDIYAFGVLVFFLIMRSYPEGFFPLPSHSSPDYKLPWDHLIIECLQPDPAKRPASIKAVMDALQGEKKRENAPKKTEDLKPKLKAKEISRPEFNDDPGAIFL